MKFSVLINNYNNGPFLRECVDSVLAQSRAPDEIIFVDDGSTDDSLAILREHYGSHPLLKIISQSNSGQTSAMATAVEHATGDIFCLLDADDRYKPQYLERIGAIYTGNPHVDLVFCRYESFGTGKLWNNEGIWLEPQHDYDYGQTALLTYFGKTHWIGNFTSTISLRRKLARAVRLRDVSEKLHIYTQADYSILLGASLLGGIKYYLHEALVDYRNHSTSDSYKRRTDDRIGFNFEYLDTLRINYFKQRSFIGEIMKELLAGEAATIPAPLPGHLEFYKVPKKQSLPRRIISRVLRLAKRTPSSMESGT